MTSPATTRPKLIEVALPLAAINRAAGKEKTIGAAPHPQNIHRWWARRPLTAARAVIWASLVDDPSGDPTLSVEEQEAERQRLFGILEQLVKWENSNNPDVLRAAKAEIDRCFPDGPPPVLDPFGGGGAIPLEAQRLGLRALSGDLNPVAVLIQKAMIEIPPRFAGMPPVHPDAQDPLKTWERAQGLAADVAAYGEWMRDEAHKRIGHLYPDATGPNGAELTPLAWIWARTVESPDPSWRGHVPLVASWVLARAPGRATVWIEPIIDRDTQTIAYEVRTGGTPSIKPSKSTCIATGATITKKYIKEQGLAGKIGQQLIAVVAQGSSQRYYCEPNKAHETAASVDLPAWFPDSKLPDKGLGFRVQAYGMDEWWKLFTPRQLTALTTFSDLLKDVRTMAECDASAAGQSADVARLHEGGRGAAAYADAITTYLAFAVDKCADHWSSACAWHNSHSPQVRNVFARQAIAMTWDFAEANPFSGRLASWDSMLGGLSRALAVMGTTAGASVQSSARQRDARARVRESTGAVISTDPPYYDNVGYADLSDFFYVWLRRNLRDVWPDECATLATPKADEMVADPDRYGSRAQGKKHFESGMADFMADVALAQAADTPATIYYAYKATETKDGEVRSTGWDTFLQAVLDAGLQVTATWPMRTELANRMRGLGSNALASSIVLACRPRNESAAMASRGEFVSALKAELPEAVRVLQSGNIAPVDLAQSTIGPGIKVFSRYAKVVEADGSAMSVSDALAIINDVLGELLDGEEAELDRDTRFAVTWYTQHGYNPASSGEADSLANAKNTSLAGIAESGVGEARSGQFRLFERHELDPDWDPIADNRATVWEATQHLIAALERSESDAGALMRRMGGYADRARQLAYVLFTKATENGWASEAGAYNDLITAWPTLATRAAGSDAGAENQGTLL